MSYLERTQCADKPCFSMVEHGILSSVSSSIRELQYLLANSINNWSHSLSEPTAKSTNCNGNGGL